jgi:hypothetical protein
MFANFALNHGVGSTANINLLHVTGARNMFKNVHFACYNATELDGDGYAMVKLDDCSEVSFQGCLFGSDSVMQSTGTIIEWAANTTIRAIFQDCNWTISADDSTVTFIDVKAGAGRGPWIFKNCMFINMNTAMTVGILGTGLSNARFYFDSNSMFAGVTDVVAAAYEGYCLMSPSHYVSTGAAAGVYAGLFQSYDTSS